MKKFIFVAVVAAALCQSLWGQKFGQFTMRPKGVIDFNSHYIQTESGNTYQQSELKSPQVSVSDGVYEISGDYVIKDQPPFKFSEKIAKTKNGIDFESTVSRDTGFTDDFALVLYMPTKLYKGKVWIDDSNELKDAQFIAKKIRVVGEKYTLEISGEFECEMRRYRGKSRRDWGVYDNIRISINYLKDSETSRSLKLKMRAVKNFVASADMGKAVAPLGLPMPDGTVHFASTQYNITKGVKGLVIPAGKSAAIGGSKKRAKYLEILNGFASLPKDVDALGKVVVSYVDGSSASFDITKSNSGAIADGEEPKGATVAWRGEHNGGNAAMYTTEIPLAHKAVRSVKLVNSSGADWKIAAATYSATQFGVIPNGEYYVMQNDAYCPIENKRPAVKGSILDMSFALDAPAGKYGRVKVVNGSFAFEKRPDKPVRFYGANNVFKANAPSHEDAVRLADQYVALGFNVARIHHYDRLCTTTKNGDSAELDEAVMDRFDFLFNELKKRGVYMTIDFYTTRQLLPSEYDDIKYDGDNMKLVFSASDKGLENLRRFIRNFLTHVNKYTGLAYKDDPALFSACIRNESSHVGNRNFVVRTPFDYEAILPKYEKWLAQNKSKWEGRSERELWQIFQLDVYDQTHAKLLQTVRELAPGLIVSDQNHVGGFMTKAMSKTYDFASQNAYYGHPNYIETKYTLPQEIRSDPPIGNYGGDTVRALVAEIFGKPLIITEWNYMSPNPYCSQGAFLVGAYSALNDVGGLCYFAYSHSDGAISNNYNIGGFDFASNPILTLAHRAAIMMYLRGDVKPATVSFPIPLLTSFYRNGATKGSTGNVAEATYLGLVGRVGHVLADSVDGAKIPSDAAAVLMSEDAWKSAKFSAPAYDIFSKGKFLKSIAESGRLDKGKIDLENKTFRSSTGELFMDVGKLNWKAITPKTEAYALLEGQSLRGDFASVKSLTAQASVLISAYDNKPLRDSNRILILHLTDVMNSRQKFATPEKDVLLERGERLSAENPLLVRAGKIRITVDSPLDGFKLYAVNTAGERLYEVPIARVGGRSILNLSVSNPKGTSIAYELINGAL